MIPKPKRMDKSNKTILEKYIIIILVHSLEHKIFSHSFCKDASVFLKGKISLKMSAWKTLGRQKGGLYISAALMAHNIQSFLFPRGNGLILATVSGRVPAPRFTNKSQERELTRIIQG